MILKTDKIKTAMIIDDNDLDHILYRRIFERSNRIGNLINFIYADEALEYLKNNDCECVDVIFLDINMPRMNGFEFLTAATQELGKSFTQAVVVMLTTSIDKKDQERAQKFHNVKAYLNKPLREEDIGVIVDSILLESD